MVKDQAQVRLASVVVLNFNGESIIGKCLDHLLAQTYPNYEIIVVDNNSTDGSRAAIEPFLTTGKVSVVASRTNLGVPGGRNLGLRAARGEIIAFIDNDGYADRNWLSEAIATLESQPDVGAVASVVFFAQSKAVLNGAGGTMNRSGFGGDLCFNVPYEFAEIPREVLYPMGCGMVLSRRVMDRVGRFDGLLFKYYEDLELGIRVWKSGLRVVVAPGAWVDHDCGHSDQFFSNKYYLCQRHRIRTVLKYYPLWRLPAWFMTELKAAHGVGLMPWLWNLRHFGSLLKWRLKFIGRSGSFWHLVDPSQGSFPPPTPNNQDYRPDSSRLGPQLVFNGTEDYPQLNFGWFYQETDGQLAFRWTQAQASALFRFDAPVRSCAVWSRVPSLGQRAEMIIRPLGELEPAERIRLRPSPAWGRRSYPCRLAPGSYEVLLVTERTFRDPSGRALGVGISSIMFE
jgi:GT2 family glycosyltransferase